MPLSHGNNDWGWPEATFNHGRELRPCTLIRASPLTRFRCGGGLFGGTIVCGAGTCFPRCVLKLLKKQLDGSTARLIALRAVRSLAGLALRRGTELGVPPQTPPRVSPLEPDKGFALDPVSLRRGFGVTTRRGAGTCFPRRALYHSKTGLRLHRHGRRAYLGHIHLVGLGHVILRAFIVINLFRRGIQ